MVSELTNYIGRAVYNPRGQYVGSVANVIIDLPERRVGSLLIGKTNPALIDGGRDIAVPYRWVGAAGDVVLLSTFPGQVQVAEEVTEEEEAIAA